MSWPAEVEISCAVWCQNAYPLVHGRCASSSHLLCIKDEAAGLSCPLCLAGKEQAEPEKPGASAAGQAAPPLPQQGNLAVPGDATQQQAARAAAVPAEPGSPQESAGDSCSPAKAHEPELGPADPQESQEAGASATKTTPVQVGSDDASSFHKGTARPCQGPPCTGMVHHSCALPLPALPLLQAWRERHRRAMEGSLRSSCPSIMVPSPAAQPSPAQQSSTFTSTINDAFSPEVSSATGPHSGTGSWPSPSWQCKSRQCACCHRCPHRMTLCIAVHASRRAALAQCYVA